MVFQNKSILLKSAAFLMAFMAATVLPCWCQQVPASKPSVPELLTKLHSRHWSERIDAIEKIDVDEALLQSRTIQVALIDLLNREVAEDATSQDAGTDDDGEEEYSQYLTSVSYIVNKFVDWNDPRQACMMVKAAYMDYPSSAPQAAAVARAAMPCILKRSKSNVASDREIASPMLVEAIQKARGTLDAETAQNAKQIVLSDLRDPDLAVRFETVYALGKYAGTDMIPALAEVAANDRAPEVEADSIRKSAAQAIADIEQRAGQQEH
jgi:hypothetical protein